jgi:hypothetical protein
MQALIADLAETHARMADRLRRAIEARPTPYRDERIERLRREAHAVAERLAAARLKVIHENQHAP